MKWLFSVLSVVSFISGLISLVIGLYSLVFPMVSLPLILSAILELIASWAWSTIAEMYEKLEIVSNKIAEG